MQCYMYMLDTCISSAGKHRLYKSEVLVFTMPLYMVNNNSTKLIDCFRFYPLSVHVVFSAL